MKPLRQAANVFNNYKKTVSQTKILSEEAEDVKEKFFGDFIASNTSSFGKFAAPY